MTALAAPLLIGAEQPASLEVSIAGLRNQVGSVRLCLTRNPKYFPDCGSDPNRRALTIAAGAMAEFSNLAAGTYAIAAFHDENGNARLDKALAIPREGFGFSQNPAIRFGPPKFDEARFDLVGGPARTTIRIRYIL